MTETYQVERSVKCLDSDCDGSAVQESDFQSGGGILTYWVCGECEMEFGHSLERRPAETGGSCQLGVPEPVRRASSKVFIGTIARRPE